MAAIVTSRPISETSDVGATDPRWTRWLLTSLAIGFLTLFVILPAANVFVQAFEKGWSGYTRVLFPDPVPQTLEQRPTHAQLRRMSETQRAAEEAKWALRARQESVVASAEKNWASIRLTLLVVAIVVPLNALFGLAAAWAVTRFRFRGRTLLISLIDLPFSVSPVVSGLIFVLVFGAQGILQDLSRASSGTFLVPVVRTFPAWGSVMLLAWILWRWSLRFMVERHASVRAAGFVQVACFAGAGAIAAAIIHRHAGSYSFDWQFLAPSDWKIPNITTSYYRGFADSWWPFATREVWEGVIFTPVSIVLATTFVTFPFVARTLIPVMDAAGADEEVAALSLGATGGQMFRKVTIPNVKWGLLYGIILCLARACGEFGAVSVVSGHRESNDTMPLRIEKLWQEYNNQGAFAMASILTLLAVVTLLMKVLLEWRMARANRPIAVAAEEPAPAPAEETLTV